MLLRRNALMRDLPEEPVLVLSPEPVLVLSPEPVLVISPEPVLVISPFRTPADCTPFAPDNSKEEDFSSGAWPIGASANSVGELAELAPQPMDFATVRCRVRSAHKIFHLINTPICLKL